MKSMIIIGILVILLASVGYSQTFEVRIIRCDDPGVWNPPDKIITLNQDGTLDDTAPDTVAGYWGKEKRNYWFSIENPEFILWMVGSLKRGILIHRWQAAEMPLCYQMQKVRD